HSLCSPGGTVPGLKCIVGKSMTASAGLLTILLLAAPRMLAVAPPPRSAEAWSGVLRAGGGHAGASLSGDEAPLPPSDDRDHDRILRLQAALKDIVHAAFGRLKVGLRVVEAHSGRVIFGRAPMTLMDPASNQKVLATTTALMRLGSDW